MRFVVEKVFPNSLNQSRRFVWGFFVFGRIQGGA